MNRNVLIVAGGTGKRMKTNIPKQFLTVAGKPVLMHTIQRFYYFDGKMNIIVVLPFDHIETWNRLCSEHRFPVPHLVITGGEERFYSVKNGLGHVPVNELVAIHDGVRPLVSEYLIQRSFEAAARYGSAIPVIIPAESLRKIEGTSSHPADRNQFRLVQTPQTFKSSLITEAYNQPYHIAFTDDATVFEASGHQVHLIEGEPENIKITRPADFRIAEALLSE